MPGNFGRLRAPSTLNPILIGTRTTRRTGEELIQSYGAYASDIGGDGDLDITGIDELEDLIFLFEN